MNALLLALAVLALLVALVSARLALEERARRLGLVKVRGKWIDPTGPGFVREEVPQ